MNQRQKKISALQNQQKKLKGIVLGKQIRPIKQERLRNMEAICFEKNKTLREKKLEKISEKQKEMKYLGNSKKRTYLKKLY